MEIRNNKKVKEKFKNYKISTQLLRRFNSRRNSPILSGRRLIQTTSKGRNSLVVNIPKEKKKNQSIMTLSFDPG